jgi:hypothetical protein
MNDVLLSLCPSSPDSAEACASLFDWFTATTAQSDFSCTYMSAVRFMAFADRSCSFEQDGQEISRFSCLLFLSVRGFSDYAGPDQSTRDYRGCRVAFLPYRNGVGVLIQTGLQDSRPGWSRCLLSCRALSSPTTCRLSGRAMARTGLRMMPTFPSSPLKFRTVSFPAVRLQGWLIERCLPSIRRPIVTPVWFASLLRDPRFQPGLPRSVSEQLCAGAPPF